METNQLPKRFKNGTAALILGIVSLVMILLFCCLGFVGCIIGVVCSGIGLYLANKELKEAAANGDDPKAYLDYKNLNAGKIMCIIGLILNGLGLVACVILFAIYGAAIMSAGGMEEFLRELENR